MYKLTLALFALLSLALPILAVPDNWPHNVGPDKRKLSPYNGNGTRHLFPSCLLVMLIFWLEGNHDGQA
jgi:hypothetical protein